ncbi:MAG: aminotransferase class I/II-fold pyridoxal phosphate-dependent enzyme [Candidatus Nitrotoga sp.]
MSNPGRALVTGGAGFIGSELVAQLVANGWDVVVLDNLATGRWENLDSLMLAANAKATGDVRDTKILARLMEGVDTVFHLACRGVRFSLHSPLETHEVNATGTLAVLDAARQARVQRFVCVSSSEVYGTATDLPLREDSPTFPTTAYGASKLAGEAYARAYHRCYGVPVTIVRPFNSFGPRAHHEGDAGEVIPKFVLRALAGQTLTLFGDGEQTRDFCYVSDTAHGIILAATVDAAIGETINLGSGKETSIQELAQAVLAAVGREQASLRFDAARPGDLPRLCAATEKAQRLLDFRPAITFSEGLNRLIAWYGRDQNVAEKLLCQDVVRNWELTSDKSTSIPIARPESDEREAGAVCRVLASGWWTQGPEVEAFEREFAAYVGVPHACAVSSGTTALHLALLVAGVEPGDEVITVSHSFIATASAIRYCGALPVFVDIDPATFNIDPRLIEAAITPRTRAIVCVHQIGMPCDLAAILPLAHRHGLTLIEDAACAAGSEILWDGQWQKIGRPHGDLACFSFHPRKVLSTGDGGMITTANGDWDTRLRGLRHHGMDVAAHARHVAPAVICEGYRELGYNYRLTDVQAAIGREQLAKLPDIVRRRRALAARYCDLLRDAQATTLPHEPKWARSNWQSFALRLAADLDQRATMQALLDRGIATRRGVMNAHRELAYPRGTWSCGAACFGCPDLTCKRLRHSEEAQDRTILLPLFASMTEAEQDRVVTALHEMRASPPRSRAPSVITPISVDPASPLARE